MEIPKKVQLSRIKVFQLLNACNAPIISKLALYIYSLHWPREIGTVIRFFKCGNCQLRVLRAVKGLEPTPTVVWIMDRFLVKQNFQMMYVLPISLSLGSWALLYLEIRPAVNRPHLISAGPPAHGAGMLPWNQQSENSHLRLNICLAISSSREVSA